MFCQHFEARVCYAVDICLICIFCVVAMRLLCSYCAVAMPLQCCCTDQIFPRFLLCGPNIFLLFSSAGQIFSFYENLGVEWSSNLQQCTEGSRFTLSSRSKVFRRPIRVCSEAKETKLEKELIKLKPEKKRNSFCPKMGMSTKKKLGGGGKEAMLCFFFTVHCS